MLRADCDGYICALHAGEYLLLCSDGLINTVTDQEMLFEVIHGDGPETCLAPAAGHRQAPGRAGQCDGRPDAKTVRGENMEHMDQYIGKMLDNRYEILERIGTGGMAVVYKAKCHRLNRLVAVKILKSDLAQDEDFRRRFNARVPGRRPCCPTPTSYRSTMCPRAAIWSISSWS